MNTRRAVIIAAAVVGAALMATLFWPWEREPVYQGKKLSEWLAQPSRAKGHTFVAALPCSRKDPQAVEEARHAVIKIGANAIPSVLSFNLDFQFGVGVSQFDRPPATILNCSMRQTNEPHQPTPGVLLAACRTPLVQRGCATH